MTFVLAIGVLVAVIAACSYYLGVLNERARTQLEETE